VEEAIVVGAMDINDRIARFSNFGGIVDVFAPGVGVTSAGIKNNKDTNTLNDTSMSWSVCLFCCPVLPSLSKTGHRTSVNYSY